MLAGRNFFIVFRAMVIFGFCCGACSFDPDLGSRDYLSCKSDMECPSGCECLEQVICVPQAALSPGEHNPCLVPEHCDSFADCPVPGPCQRARKSIFDSPPGFRFLKKKIAKARGESDAVFLDHGIPEK